MHTYVVGGRLGDVLHCLWVVKRQWEMDGRKGIVVMSDRYGGDSFDRGLRGTWEDVRPLVEAQDYVERLELDDGGWEPSRDTINLNAWRTSSLVCKTDWKTMLSGVYRVDREEIGEGWLTWDDKTGVLRDEIKTGLVVVHQSKRRHSEFPWASILKNNKCLFVTCDKSEYEVFPYKGMVECYVAGSIGEMASIISSAKAFCGNQSMPLALAAALGKTCYCQLNSNCRDDVIMYMGLGANIFFGGRVPDEVHMKFK